MGVGGIKTQPKMSIPQGPPKPPRVLDKEKSGHSLDRLNDPKKYFEGTEYHTLNTYERNYDRYWDQRGRSRER